MALENLGSMREVADPPPQQEAAEADCTGRKAIPTMKAMLRMVKM